MKQPLVSMIVSNLNGMSLNLLPECIDSLIKTEYPNWELIVVDNDSTDDSLDYLKKKFAKRENCHIAINPVNMYSQGLNLGAKYANGEYLAYFNNDVGLEKGYFQELISKFQKDKKLAIAQGKLLNYRKRNVIDSAGETMDKFGNPVTIGAGEKDKGQYDNEEEILSASGSACIIKKSIFEKLGGYDSVYGIGYEDMDLALRARRAGFTVKRFPKAVIYHKRASTDLAPFIRLKVKWHFNKNRFITMIKNYPGILLLTSIPFTVILYLGIGLYEMLFRSNFAIGWTRFTSMFWVLFNVDSILEKKEELKKTGARELSDDELKLFSQKSIPDFMKSFLQLGH